MADTTVNSANRVEQWADDEFYEYVRLNPLKSLMGQGENAIFQVKEELTKARGDKITFSLVTRLTGAGVTGDNELAGNEEALGNYGHQVTIDQIRHGVVVGEFEQIKTKIDLLNAAKAMLRLWNMEKLRDLFLSRMFSPVVDGLTTYAAATEAQKNAWLVANNPSTANQRILFGAAKSNGVSGVHATALALIDGTADDLHQDIIRLEKRNVQGCRPSIRPHILSADSSQPGKERFVALAGSLAFRDLEANYDTTRRDVEARGESNGIYQSGDIMVGNVVVKEVPEMDRLPADGGCLLENVGDSGTTEVSPVFMLGAQSLFLAWGSRMKVKTDSWDYGNRRGVAVAEIRGCEKSTFNQFQHGMGTIYVSAVGD